MVCVIVYRNGKKEIVKCQSYSYNEKEYVFRNPFGRTIKRVSKKDVKSFRSKLI